MFCPKCGKADQVPEIYCRGCGLYLEDFTKPAKRETPIEQNLKINSFFSLGTAIVSLALAITLYATLIGREGTPWIIYAVFGFLMTITGWQIQVYIRTKLLKRQFAKLRHPRMEEAATELHSPSAHTARLTDGAGFDTAIPASVAEDTTRILQNNGR